MWFGPMTSAAKWPPAYKGSLRFIGRSQETLTAFSLPTNPSMQWRARMKAGIGLESTLVLRC
jgi:hypothetical protein